MSSAHGNRRHPVLDLVDTRRRWSGAGSTHPLFWAQTHRLGQLGIARVGHSILRLGCLDALPALHGPEEPGEPRPVYFSFAMPALALVRVAVGKRLSERVYAASFITALCVVAGAVFFMVPFKPE